MLAIATLTLAASTLAAPIGAVNIRGGQTLSNVDIHEKVRVHGMGWYVEGVGFYMDGVGLIEDPVSATVEQCTPKWARLQAAAASGAAEASGAAAAHAQIAREEAARKLIVNHARVLRDVTNAMPLTQPELQRAELFDAPYVDQALRETARRLLGRHPGLQELEEQLDPSAAQQAHAWAITAHYMDRRIQATAAERPGRAPDMSEEAAAAMRAVLMEVAQQQR